jgi:hypothetical protein
MNKYEEMFLKWLDEQKAKNVEPKFEELERRAINMAHADGRQKRDLKS